MKRTRWITTLMAMVLVVAACGGTETTDTTTAADADTTAAVTETTTAATETTAAATETTAAATDTTAPGGTDTTAAGGEGEPIVFGASLPLTGEFSISGSKHANGYQFCVDEINARGGLLGRPVELLVEDNRSDTEVTVTQTQRFINVENVDALLGTFSSLLGFPASTVAEQNGMIYPMPSNGALRIWERGYQHIFYFQQLPAEYTGRSVLNMVDHYEAEGIIGERPQTAAVVYADDFFAAAIATGLLGGTVEIPDSGEIIDLAPGFLADAGMEVAFEEVWPIGYTDWLTLANSIRQADADFLVISSASTDEVIALLQALQTVGYQAPLVYTAQGAQTEFQEALGEAADGIVVHSVWSPLANFPSTLAGEPYTNEDFVSGYTESFGEPPDEDEAIPFAVCQGVEQAIIGTGGTDNAAMSEWMHTRTADTAVETIVGNFVWDEKGLAEERSFLINQWQDGGLSFVFPVGEFPGTVDVTYPKPEW
ncbi:MAG: ABC transporter substrate-binding protein [Actinobacteria bacterium]|nr:ABC transporter substrate-binding protein [Actinomycetota bacterium]